MQFPFRSPNLPTLSTHPPHTIRNLIPAVAHSSGRTLFYQRHPPPPSQFVLCLPITVNPQCLLGRQLWAQMHSHLLTVLHQLLGPSSCVAPSALLPPPFGNRMLDAESLFLSFLQINIFCRISPCAKLYLLLQLPFLPFHRPHSCMTPLTCHLFGPTKLTVHCLGEPRV